jgi:hypothetical protein
MSSKKRTIKGRWSTFAYNEESQEFSASFKAKAKGIDPITGFLRVVYSAAEDGFEWYVDSNKSGSLETGSDRPVFRGLATAADTDAFFDQAKQGSGVFKMKELRGDGVRTSVESGDFLSNISNYGGWRFSALIYELSEFG